MSDKGKELLQTIAKALPKMSEFEKGYFLGVAESKVSEKTQPPDKKDDPDPSDDEEKIA